MATVTGMQVAEIFDQIRDQRDAAIKRAAQLEAERDTAWTELRVIRKTIGADDNEATSDEISRLFGKLTAERDEARRQLEQAQIEVERLRRFLQTVVNLGDVKRHSAFDGERHREMRHCANQALMTTNEIYMP